MSAIPRPPQKPNSGAPPPAPARKLTFEKPPDHQRIVLYGKPGHGKTTLVDAMPGPVAFFDLDDSLGPLTTKGAVKNAQRIAGIKTWEDLRGTLNGDGWDEIKTVVIDTLTRAQDLATEFMLKTVMHPENHVRVDKMEDYGYGKGYRFLLDVFLPLLSDLDRHVHAGRHIVLICHESNTEESDNDNENWREFTLQLMHTDKNSIRKQVIQWADHVLFMEIDRAVLVNKKSKRGKSVIGNSRTIYTAPCGKAVTKCRTLDEPWKIDGSDDQEQNATLAADFWAALLGKKQDAEPLA